MNIAAVGQALTLAVKSQFHPKMLALLIGPFFLSLVVWAAIAWFVWDPLTARLGQFFFDGGWLAQLNQWIVSIGLPAPKSWLVKFMTFMLLLPLMFVTAMVLTSILAMPAVIRHLQEGQYGSVTRLGKLAVMASVGNSLVSLLIFTVGYLCTIPLWFIPPLILIVPWLWWGWLNSRILRLDSLLEHATLEERVELIKLHKTDYRLLGLAVASLNFLPPLFIVAPVFGALSFAHYSFNALQQYRNQNPQSRKITTA
jgi:Etoposide-induced protein 2.4 (EI24)